MKTAQQVELGEKSPAAWIGRGVARFGAVHAVPPPGFAAREVEYGLSQAYRRECIDVEVPARQVLVFGLWPGRQHPHAGGYKEVADAVLGYTEAGCVEALDGSPVATLPLEHVRSSLEKREILVLR